MANFYTPDTAVYLANTPLNVNKKDTFAPNNWTAAAQLQYFQGCIPSPTSRYTFTDFTFQRKDGVIRVPINVEVLYSAGVNYCFYRNTHYNGKWFYCFITKMEFLNENTTALYIKTDVFQTWYFQMQIKTSFVEREHTVTDELYEHTLPEPLPTPEYKNANENETRLTPTLYSRNITEFDEYYWCCIFTSEIIKHLTDDEPQPSKFLGGVPCPCYIYATNLQDYFTLIGAINYSGQANAVVSCVAMPKSMVTYHDLVNPTPPTPPPTPGNTNLLGSPYNAWFTVNQIYDPPNHKGIDMNGTGEGETRYIYSTVSGTVVYSAYHEASYSGGSFGNMICIQDDVTGYYFLFGHLYSRAVQLGDTVTRGQYIGIEGNTGDSEGRHLHYQVSSGNMWAGNIDPTTVAGAQYPNAVGTYGR